MRRLQISLSILILGSCLSVSLHGQVDSSRLIRYTPDFRFNDGIFLSFNQVIKNQPIPSIRIASKEDPFDFNFFKNLVENDMITYFDEIGTRKDVRTDRIWGFSQDGKLFIQYNDDFNRIPIVGKVGHFISDVTVTTTMYDPYHSDYYDRYYYNSYYNRPYSRTTRSKEMRQYLLDFEAGEILPFDRESVKVILMKDPELYDEFTGLNRRKQKDLLFFFIRRYNEKNPLMLPVR